MTTQTQSQELNAIYRVDPVLFASLDARPSTLERADGRTPELDPHLVELPSTTSPAPAIARALATWADAQGLDPHLIDPEQLERPARA